MRASKEWMVQQKMSKRLLRPSRSEQNRPWRPSANRRRHSRRLDGSRRQIKLGRGYFPPKSGGSKSGEKGRCFRRGSTDHQIKDCPKKMPMGKVAEEAAEIMFNAEEVYASAEAMSA